MKKYFNLFDLSQKVDYKNEVLSGLTVALALIPEAVAFALIAGLSPLTGLYAAFVMGLVTSVFGGRPGMISGATGAVAVVIVVLAKSEGVEYIFATVVLAGIIQMAAGFLRLGKLIRLVPQPVIYGFVNGLAIIIFMSQLDQFKTADGSWLTGTALYILLALVFLTMLIIWGLPKKWQPLNHWHAWVDNCLGKNTELRTPFKDGIRITEPTILSVKASRFPGQELLWDKSKLAFTNNAEATKTIVRRKYREGFAPPRVV